MVYKHEDVIRAQHEVLTAQKAQQLARYEAARLVEDEGEIMDAADQILQADHKLHALGRVANNYVAGQQSAPQSRFGLSEEEKSIAHASLVDRKDMPPLSLEERERQYAINKNRYHQMIANGSYSHQKE